MMLEAAEEAAYRSDVDIALFQWLLQLELSQYQPVGKC